MKRLDYLIYNAVLKPVLKLYLKTDSKVSFDGFKLKVFKEVFHPKLFFSTRYFYSFIADLPLNNKEVLEIGSGSGVLSMLALRKGANVTALDVDEKAVENTRLNIAANFNNPSATVLQSNVFSSLTSKTFDFILINPPYYFKKVEVDRHYAWYCGEHGEYFKDLFSGLNRYMGNTTSVYMILEENSEIDRIQEMAFEYKLNFEVAHQKKIKWETSYIFKISSEPLKR